VSRHRKNSDRHPCSTREIAPAFREKTNGTKKEALEACHRTILRALRRFGMRLKGVFGAATLLRVIQVQFDRDYRHGEKGNSRRAQFHNAKLLWIEKVRAAGGLRLQPMWLLLPR